MRYEIIKDGEVINTIAADEAFVKTYCVENGYTYEEKALPDPEPAPEVETEPTIEELMNELLGVNE